mmetsp:Transcript_30723/g.42977  ORF Transcript_30723/g.42977 Transcript_30723/m.42977 type:complete len:394 (+) Transcript_30723:476-1657(+)
MGSLQRRDNSLVHSRSFKSKQGLSIIDWLVLCPSREFHISMLGSNARIIKASRDAVCPGYLACLLLQQVGASAVKHARNSLGKGGRVLVGVNPISCCLNSDKLHVLVVLEWVKHADCVGASPHTCNDSIRQFASLLKHLCARLSSNDRLEIPHDCRKGIRSNGRANEVMRCPNIRHPITHCFINSVLQCTRSRLNCNDLCTEHFHAEYVQCLPFHISCPHIHDALHLQLCTCCSGRNPMLPSPSLSDYTLLSESFRKERLANGVVDLMCTRVVKIFPFQPNISSTCVLCESVGQMEGGGSADVGVELLALLDEFLIVLHSSIDPLELFQGFHQRLRHITPSKLPKSMFCFSKRRDSLLLLLRFSPLFFRGPLRISSANWGGGTICCRSLRNFL